MFVQSFNPCCKLFLWKCCTTDIEIRRKIHKLWNHGIHTCPISSASTSFKTCGSTHATQRTQRPGCFFVETWEPWPQSDSVLFPPWQRSTGAKHSKHSFSTMALPRGHSHTVSSSEVMVNQWAKTNLSRLELKLNLAFLAFRHPEHGSTWFYYQLKCWRCKVWKGTSCRKSANRHIIGQASFSGLPFLWTRNASLQFGSILQSSSDLEARLPLVVVFGLHGIHAAGPRFGL